MTELSLGELHQGVDDLYSLDPGWVDWLFAILDLPKDQQRLIRAQFESDIANHRLELAKKAVSEADPLKEWLGN